MQQKTRFTCIRLTYICVGTRRFMLQEENFSEALSNASKVCCSLAWPTYTQSSEDGSAVASVMSLISEKSMFTL